MSKRPNDAQPKKQKREAIQTSRYVSGQAVKSSLACRRQPKPGQTSSICNRLSSARAARSSVCSVTDPSDESRSLSNVARLVFIRFAIAVLERFRSFISSRIWKAITRLSATASASAKSPSSAKKSSKSLPRCSSLMSTPVVLPLSSWPVPDLAWGAFAPS